MKLLKILLLGIALPIYICAMQPIKPQRMAGEPIDFVALALPENLKNILISAQKAIIKKMDQLNITFAANDPDNFNITLKGIGLINDKDKREKIFPYLEIILGRNPFPITDTIANSRIVFDLKRDMVKLLLPFNWPLSKLAYDIEGILKKAKREKNLDVLSARMDFEAEFPFRDPNAYAGGYINLGWTKEDKAKIAKYKSDLDAFAKQLTNEMKPDLKKITYVINGFSLFQSNAPKLPRHYCLKKTFLFTKPQYKRYRGLDAFILDDNPHQPVEGVDMHMVMQIGAQYENIFSDGNQWVDGFVIPWEDLLNPDGSKINPEQKKEIMKWLEKQFPGMHNDKAIRFANNNAELLYGKGNPVWKILHNYLRRLHCLVDRLKGIGVGPCPNNKQQLQSK